MSLHITEKRGRAELEGLGLGLPAPCPFCGQAVGLRYDPDARKSKQQWSIMCQRADCMARPGVFAPTPQKALERWKPRRVEARTAGEAERDRARAYALARLVGLVESYLVCDVVTGPGCRALAEKELAEARLALYRTPPVSIVPAPHDFDTCDDRECAVCSEYHGGRDDGGTTQDEDSRYAPLIDPEKERRKLAQRTNP